MSKTKKLVIWLIVAVLVIGLGIGSFFFFNCNVWRFRMGAFVGEYKPQYACPDGTARLDFDIYRIDSNNSARAIKHGEITSLVEDGYECWDYVYEKKRKFSFEFDSAVRSAISDSLRLAQSNVRIRRNRIEFLDSGEVFSIKETVYGSIDNRLFKPVRYVDLDVTNTVYERILCEAHTGYWDGETPITTTTSPCLDFQMEVTRIVKGTDGNDYKIRITLYYTTIKE